MKTIVLVSCVKSKLKHAARADELYISPLFKGYMRLARRLAPDEIFILSAQHGLLRLDDVVEPYERTLKRMRKPEIDAWAKEVLNDLGSVADVDNDHFAFLAGADYRRPLTAHLRHVEIPFEGVSFFEQLSRLKSV